MSSSPPTVIALAITLVVFLSSCSSQQDKALQQAADRLKPCEKVSALLDSYATGFEALKGRSLSERFVGVFAARIHAVGQDCQVWQLSDNTTYMCGRSAPNREVAMEWYQNSLDALAQCLSGWSGSEPEGGDSDGQKILWSHPDTTAVIAMQAVPVTRNLRGGRWSLYYYIGNQPEWY
ncbi:hypothetical protein DXV75_15600 [Alteromonas aestuariivivens]|uniref:Uncharacterized protein n=1 Tax=Alteromonas aestuariivivens TaxID=1938339 RepID=A0A3D8M4P3_9ALTE|nr:hypothetical protein [Alteromonas aestuariivivens]RDV24112.1 hypothetical protein DXV75_15600 [Alteromonas aestuariivivens]